MPPAVLEKIKKGGTTHGKQGGIGVASAIALFAGVSIKTFNRTADFRKVLASLPKSTPIYIDSNLREATSGEDFAKELYDQGMTELYLASGHPRGHFGDLPWIKDFVGKEPPF